MESTSSVRRNEPRMPPLGFVRVGKNRARRSSPAGLQSALPSSRRADAGASQAGASQLRVPSLKAPKSDAAVVEFVPVAAHQERVGQGCEWRQRNASSTASLAWSGAVRAPLGETRDRAWAARETMQVIVEVHAPLVRELAKRWAQSPQDAEELESEGCLALLEAARDYRLESRVPFSRFARGRIESALLSYIRRNAESRSQNDSLPEMSPTTGLMRCDEAAEDRLGPSWASTVGDATRRRVGADAPSDPKPSPEAAMLRSEEPRVDLKRALHAMQALSGRERFVLRRRYLTTQPEDHRTLGKTMRMHSAQVRALELAALRKMRHQLAEAAVAWG